MWAFMQSEGGFMRKIKICSRHQNYKTPLIWTFAFPYAEYWCPACGAHEGMLGAGENVPWTWRLHHKYLKYKNASKRFLRANVILVCAYFRYKGKDIKPEEMPEKLRKYYEREAKNWRYRI